MTLADLFSGEFVASIARSTLSTVSELVIHVFEQEYQMDVPGMPIRHSSS